MTLDRTSATLVADEHAGVDREDPGGRVGLGRPRPRRGLTPDRVFWLGVVAAVALGAVVRLLYLFHAAPVWVGGDGFDYSVVGTRLADGFGFTKSPDGIHQFEYAHHPPGWASVLAVVTQLGFRSMRAHQVTGLVIGLGVIVVAGLVGRRYGGRRVGVVAALLAAVYPGFWVIDVQILSEPLGLAVLGLLMLVLADLWERPTLARALLTGGLLGALTLVRGEELALLALAVAPILLLNRRLGVGRRFAFLGAAAAMVVVLVAPWAIYNVGRFEEPVVLSTNGGTTLLAGNCPPSTYGGERMGSFDTACNKRRGRQNPGLDAAQSDVSARHLALHNIRDNVDRLPSTVIARYGRVLAVFRPAQTVAIDADWFGAARWPVWAWVTSFWVLLPLAVAGSVLLRRSRRFQWPLVAPAVIVVVVVTVTFGDPRYHTMADLGAVVLAAVATCAVVRRIGRPPRHATGDSP